MRVGYARALPSAGLQSDREELKSYIGCYDTASLDASIGP